MKMIKEEWRWIPCYHGLYEASNFGNIKSYWKKTVIALKQLDNGHGYKFVTLHDINGVKKQIYVHRIIWITFKGDIPENMEIDHLDCDRANNCISNLRTVTHAENMTISRVNMKLAGKTSTCHPGVIKKKRGFEVDVKIEGIYLYIGHFTDFESACIAADEAYAGRISPAAKKRLEEQKILKIKKAS